MKLILNKLNLLNNMPKALKDKWVERGIIWGVPTAVVPTFRYLEDTDKPDHIRNELFLRDFAGYGIGSAIFISTLALLEKHKKIKPVHALLTASVAAATWCGLLDPKLSKFLTRDNDRTTKLPAIEILNFKGNVSSIPQNKSHVLNRAANKLDFYS